MSGRPKCTIIRWRVLVAAALLAIAQGAPALIVTFNYDFDSLDFFDPGTADGLAARAALEEAGDFFESRLSDNLSEIAPGGFNTWTAGFTHPGTGVAASVLDLEVAAEQIIIYAGARDLGGSTLGIVGPGSFSVAGTQAFVDIVSARGQGAVDFGPWGGGLAMNSTSSWYFGIGSLPPGGTNDFFSTALHEIGHILGIGTADSWDDMIVAGEFTGTASVAAFGANVPLQPVSFAHWAAGTSSTVAGGSESYITNPGAAEEVAFDPNLTVASCKLVTDLDLAGLSDIGWQVVPVPAAFWMLMSGTVMLLLRQRTPHRLPAH